MTKDQLELVLGRVITWPKEAQDELLRSVERIEAAKVGVYNLSADERTAVEQGLAQADRGEFVSDEEMDAFFDGKDA
jgi:hypothetical protein